VFVYRSEEAEDFAFTDASGTRQRIEKAGAPPLPTNPTG